MNDDLDPARGLALGCVTAAFLWAIIFAIAWFFLPGPW